VQLLMANMSNRPQRGCTIVPLHNPFPSSISGNLWMPFDRGQCSCTSLNRIAANAARAERSFCSRQIATKSTVFFVRP
jgi:hypothetical protein